MSTRHWTDDELIAHLYGVGPADQHDADCPECQARLAGMRQSREQLDRLDAVDVPFDFMAVQRRRIYERMNQPHQWWSMRRLAPALATLLILSGGAFVYEQQHQQSTQTAAMAKISDQQLVDDVAAMVDDPEPSAVAPLQALFEE